MKNKVKKKATNREMTDAIIEINRKVEHLWKLCSQLDGIVGLYIEMNGDKEKFNALVQKKYEEHEKTMKEKNDQAGNGTINPENIQPDSKDKGSGAEGIRKES